MNEITLSRGERTRAAIIKAAHLLFINQGYHGTSMRQIASQCGIALSSLYNHFPSKEDVFKSVFVENHPYHEILPALSAAEGQDIEALVKDAASRFLISLRSHPDLLNLMFIEIVEFNNAHAPELFNQIFPQVMQMARRIADLGGGRMRQIPTLVLMRAFMGLFFSYYITDLIISPSAPPQFQEGAIEYFVDIYLHGILSESQQEARS